MAASRAAEAAADAERRRIVEETLLTERAAEKAIGAKPAAFYELMEQLLTLLALSFMTSVEDFLNMEGPPKSHGELKDEAAKQDADPVGVLGVVVAAIPSSSLLSFSASAKLLVAPVLNRRLDLVTMVSNVSVPLPARVCLQARF
ncbi:unnamed protein product [Symbiodinium sp. KB8]|nr:unnamed protein product [Symbiodinium sp. KB8]